MTIDQDRQTAATAALIDGFNQIFLRHNPAAVRGMIAEDCIIEKISPAPDGDRCVGRDACVALWTAIATAPGTRFELEETFVMNERAIIRWHFWSSDGIRCAVSI